MAIIDVFDLWGRAQFVMVVVYFDKEVMLVSCVRSLANLITLDSFSTAPSWMLTAVSFGGLISTFSFLSSVVFSSSSIYSCLRSSSSAICWSSAAWPPTTSGVWSGCCPTKSEIISDCSDHYTTASSWEYHMNLDMWIKNLFFSHMITFLL